MRSQHSEKFNNHALLFNINPTLRLLEASAASAFYFAQKTQHDEDFHLTHKNSKTHHREIFSMNALLEMNDFASSLIECREYRNALEILNHCLTRVPKHKQSSIDTTIMKRAKASMNSSHIKQLASKPKKNNDDGTGFIYRNPVRLTESDSEMATSAVLIFNIAICHHLLALDSFEINRRNSIKRLRGALKLYELAFHMHSKEGTEGMSLNFSLALINNCAKCYEILGSASKAQRFYDHMLSSLMMLIENGEAQKLDQLEGYLLNASRLILSKDVVAPAA
jgi:hypothetical protein